MSGHKPFSGLKDRLGDEAKARLRDKHREDDIPDDWRDDPPEDAPPEGTGAADPRQPAVLSSPGTSSQAPTPPQPRPETPGETTAGKPRGTP